MVSTFMNYIFCSDCCFKTKKVNKIIKNISLSEAQNITKTTSGRAVSLTVLNHFYTKEQLQTSWKNRFADELWKELFSEPLNVFTKITGNLFLTGMGGISEENIREYKIKCLINGTHELPKYDRKGIEFIRIPVEDSPNENLYPFFDELSAKLEENDKKDIKTVIYCMGGVSRSPTFVIAYLMKSRKYHLKEAFSYVRTRRPSIHPNHNFLSQLVGYEKNLFKKNFITFVEVEDKDGIKSSVPDFTIHLYPESSDDPETEPDVKNTDLDKGVDQNIDMKLSKKYNELSK